MEEEKTLTCLRCGAAMRRARTTKLQLGEAGVLLGIWPNLYEGALAVDVYACPECGKLEFFHARSPEAADTPQRTCPNCGRTHDFDFPKCPFCKYDYYGGK